MKQLTWSGHNWKIKSSHNYLAGPGPNYFSDQNQNVFIDAQDNLHMKIINLNGKFMCSEIINTQNLGYGTYQLRIVSKIDHFHPNIVLGIFTWDDNPADNHRQIDIQVSKWLDKQNQNNLQYVIQPYQKAGNIYKLCLSHSKTDCRTTHQFTWTEKQVSFSVYQTDKQKQKEKRWIYLGSNVPKPGKQNFRINLWLYKGDKLIQQLKQFQVVLKQFSYKCSDLKI